MDEGEEYKECSATSKEEKTAASSWGKGVDFPNFHNDKNNLEDLLYTSSSAIAHVRSLGKGPRKELGKLYV